MTVVRKSELADRLGISRPRVSHFISLGMPVRDDGRIELEQACEWVLDNVIDQWTDDASPAVRAAEQILSEIWPRYGRFCSIRAIQLGSTFVLTASTRSALGGGTE